MGLLRPFFWLPPGYSEEITRRLVTSKMSFLLLRPIFTLEGKLKQQQHQQQQQKKTV